MIVSLYSVFLLSLLITITVEGAVIMIIFRRKAYVYYSALCNLLTNPAMNLLLAGSVRLFGVRAYYPALFTSELIVLCVEAVVYTYICGFRLRKSIALSALLNAASFTAGALLNAVVR